MQLDYCSRQDLSGKKSGSMATMKAAIVLMLAGLLSPAVAVGPTVQVTCDTNSMTVYFNKLVFDSLSDASEVHFEDKNCVGMESDDGSHVVIKTAYDECQTRFKETDDTITYSNVVTYFYPTSIDDTLITRDEILRTPVECHLKKRQQVDNEFLPNHIKEPQMVEGFGNFSVSMDRYLEDDFKNIASVPSVNLSQALYFQVNLSSVMGLGVYADVCWATPYPNPANKNYTFIDDGCGTGDTTFMFIDTEDPALKRYTIRAFTFVEEEPMVFVHCSVLVCNISNPDSPCAQGQDQCPDPGARKRRSLRDADLSWFLAHKVVSNGPIYALKSRPASRKTRSVASDDNSAYSSSLFIPLVGACGGLVGLVAGVVTMLIYLRLSRRKRSTGYQNVPNLVDE